MKPLLAGKIENLDNLRFPLVASPKIDGIRCLIIDGMARSRKLKPIPNIYICQQLRNKGLNGLDGELLIEGKPFNEISSAVMSEDGRPDFQFIAFDCFNDPDLPYAMRLQQAMVIVEKANISNVDVIESKILGTVAELSTYEGVCLSRGYEGVMTRSVDGRYKYGRSTSNEQILLKLKRFEDSEAVIIGAIEEQYNGNAAMVDELGHTKRSSHKANLHGKGCLGAFRVRRADGLEFNVGSGFTAEQRKLYWEGIDMLVGKTIVYKHQPSGSKDAPRFPIFKGFRHTDDM